MGTEGMPIKLQKGTLYINGEKVGEATAEMTVEKEIETIDVHLFPGSSIAQLELTGTWKIPKKSRRRCIKELRRDFHITRWQAKAIARYSKAKYGTYGMAWVVCAQIYSKKEEKPCKY